MVPVSEISHLANPLALAAQLETSVSQLDGVPRELEDSVRFETTRLILAAGILLRLPQDLIAQSVVILQRFWTGPDGASLLEVDSKYLGAASLYLTAKPSAHSITPRRTLTVIEYLTSVKQSLEALAHEAPTIEASTRQLTESDYASARNRLYQAESHILRVLGFQPHVALPYSVCINYIQALNVFNSESGSNVAKRTFAYLNTALLSPQLLYLTHQPSSIATAAIYLAARETNAKLPQNEWWEVFDVDREELGFLVVALRSVDSFAMEEKLRWGQRKVPLTVEQLQAEIERRGVIGEGA